MVGMVDDERPDGHAMLHAERFRRLTDVKIFKK